MKIMIVFKCAEAPREMLTTPGLMKFYNCSDFPFNFNFIVDLTVLTLADHLTGADTMPNGHWPHGK